MDRNKEDPVEEKFSEFYEKWILHLEEYSNQLLMMSDQSISCEEEQRALVSKLTSHHKEYYTVKWAETREDVDVFAFFSPVWLAKLKNASSWITGWKPSAMFRLLDSMRKTGVPDGSLARLTEEQGRKIEELRVKVSLEEERVEEEMERQQVGTADGKIVELFRLGRRVRNGECVGLEVDWLEEVALKSVMRALERTMKAADCVIRLKTLKGILDVLSPKQSVDFLAGTLHAPDSTAAVGKQEIAERISCYQNELYAILLCMHCVLN